MPPEHHHVIDKLGLVNAVITGLALYPQLFKLAGIDSAQSGLSPLTFFLIFINNVVWLIYGIHRRMLALIITALLNIVASAVISAIILIH